MNESDIIVCVAVLAMIRARSCSPKTVRDNMETWRDSDWKPVSEGDVIQRFHLQAPVLAEEISSAKGSIDKGLALGIFPVPYSSEHYPAGLRTIEDAPPIIFIRGELSVVNKYIGVSVVGARKSTLHGMEIAKRISQYLSDNNFMVVSGLALGIDAAAHEGALLGKTPTVAVLAHGLEKAQPVTNSLLAERILENGGAWVSEYEFGIRPRPENFVRRNRIQVGLSRGSIIVEGELRSGSKTQAEFCLRNGRVLMAVLPDPDNKISTLSELPRLLVRDRGAKPIYSREDYPWVIEAIARTVI